MRRSAGASLFVVVSSSRFSQFLWKSEQQFILVVEYSLFSSRFHQAQSSLLICTTNTATYYAFLFSFAQTFIMFHFRLREYQRTITPLQSALWKIDDEKSKRRSYSWERAARLYRASRLHQLRTSIDNNIIITEAAPHGSANRSLDLEAAVDLEVKREHTMIPPPLPLRRI